MKRKWKDEEAAVSAGVEQQEQYPFSTMQRCLAPHSGGQHISQKSKRAAGEGQQQDGPAVVASSPLFVDLFRAAAPSPFGPSRMSTEEAK